MRRAPLTEALPHGCRGARHGLLAVFTLCQRSLIALVRVMLVSLGGIGSSRGWTPVKIDRGCSQQSCADPAQPFFAMRGSIGP